MLSILIPTYNYNITTLVKVLSKQALESGVLFEIIVLEDGTLDTQITQQNQSIVSINQCFYYKNQTNKGRTATRNKLSEKANFDWLLFLDADVMPLKDNFISTYVDNIQPGYELIYGGITYHMQRPDKQKILRWVYGLNREAKNVTVRKKSPYNIISQNILIHKSAFLRSNILDANLYGLDILFSYKLKVQKVTVLHIENQVTHLGLENTASFIKKSLQSLETTFFLETNKEMDFSSRPLQIKYYQLKKIGALPLLNTLVKRFEKPILKNLHSKNPSLLLFDLYRLNYYSKLKANA